MRVLFDDSIDPEVFAVSAQETVASTDLLITDRIRNSAFVVTVLVVTVTDERTAQEDRMELELLPTESPIHGSLSPFVRPGQAVKVHLGSASAGYALLRSNQAELVGKRLNLCWNRFSEGFRVAEHWHAFSDTPQNRIAIAKAAAVVKFD